VNNAMRKQVESLRVLLEKHLPKCRVHIDAPTKAKGSWFVDASLDDHHVVLECNPAKGFGLTANPAIGLGEGPEEVYSDFDSVARRLIELLVLRKRTVPPLSLRLRELRRERGVSQHELARLLHKNQAAVSKVESRGEDVRVRTLNSVIKALGGRLSLRVSFPDGMERELQLEEV
jgi:DNA-binding XRE family transcriptional regulator